MRPGSAPSSPTENTPPQIPDLSFVRHLGGGGFGDVYLYESHAPVRRVAVKVVKSFDLTDDAIRKFLAEANAMAGVEHPNIVGVYAVGRALDGRPYISMKYYPDGTMDGRLRSEQALGRQLGVPEVLRVGIEIGSAVESAHRAGLLHRDIKPANILLGRDGATALTDFGVAAQIAADSDDDEVGVSVPWAPPEMLYSDTRGSAESDVYSLAATLWQLLVGRSPFELPHGDNSRFELIKRVRDTQPPGTGRADVPPSLEALLRRALGKNPASRQPTAADFVRGLEAVERELRLPATKAVFLDDHGPISPMPPGPSSTSSGRMGMSAQMGMSAPSLPPPGGTVIRPRGAGARPRATEVPFDGVDRTLLRQAGASGTRQVAPPPVDDGGRTQTRRGTGAPPGSSGSIHRRADAETDRTQRRSSPVTVVQAPPAADPSRSGRNTGLLVSIAVAVVVVIALVGFLILRQGREPEKPTPLTTVTASTGLDVVPESGPPGPVKLAVKRVDGRVVFSWTYDNALTTDGYRIRFKSGEPVTSDQPTLSVPAPKSGQVCVSVQVRREDGSQASATWSPFMCG